jgi:hypothetical protein
LIVDAESTLAAGDTDPTFVNLLLIHGADPTVEGENGETPLSRASRAGALHGPDRPIWRLPRRNRTRGARARSRTSFEAQCCLEGRHLVGALPAV